MYNPVSTYRLQFSSDFTLKELKNFIDYLKNMHIRTLYASPVLQATSESEHGYDVVNPFRIHPPIGTEKQLLGIHKKLKESNIGWLQDIVPNHMAYTPENPWIYDLLEKGKKSIYADYFDVEWNHPSDDELYEKISLPFFGDKIEYLIKNKEIALVFNPAKGLQLAYYENGFPLNAATYELVANHFDNYPKKLSPALENMQNAKDRVEFYKRFDHLKNSWRSEFNANSGFRAELETTLAAINEDQEMMKTIVDEQYYLPEYWENTNRRINFRRFFTINDMICLNQEKASVFEHYHKYILQLVANGIIQGLRIDHIDGLFFPGEYLDRLRKVVGDEVYIIVEKILEKDEEIPPYWPVQGTTGYHYLALCNNLLTNNDAAPVFNELFEEIGGKKHVDYDLFTYNKKKFILYERMHGELDNLTNLCIRLNMLKDYPAKAKLKEAIAELLIQCPVYKLYFEKDGISNTEKKTLQDIFDDAKGNKPELREVLDNLFASIISVNDAPEEDRENKMHFLRRMMQFTGPLTAKGVEDTSFYTYNLFIAHNEVGDSPDYYGISNEDFHEAMINRQEKYPLALNATSTHDTKRGEDFRARLNVLSDLAAEWKKTVIQWREENEEFKIQLDGRLCPSPNDEYFIYQSLIGGFPVEIMEITTFVDRFKKYIIKSIREGKENSSWIKPDDAYEKGITGFIDNIVSTESPFFESFLELYRRVKDYGFLNSLSQVVLKCMSPGIPDFYQGCELWNFSMVDPDNRRKVDFKYRKKLLKELSSTKQDDNLLRTLWDKNNNGKIKFYLSHKLLMERDSNPKVFIDGEYIPLVAEGDKRNHLFGYLRRYQEEMYLVMIPLHMASTGMANLLEFSWKNTFLVTNEDIEGEWTNIFTNQSFTIKTNFAAGEILKSFPLAVLKKE